jgi:hypothetical protein
MIFLLMLNLLDILNIGKKRLASDITFCMRWELTD